MPQILGNTILAKSDMGIITREAVGEPALAGSVLDPGRLAQCRLGTSVRGRRFAGWNRSICCVDGE